MTNEPKKCKKCGYALKKSGHYADNRLESKHEYKNPSEINFWCINENCENFGKNIEVIE